MRGIVNFFVGLWILFIPIATLMFLFSDGPVGKVKSMTTRQMVQVGSAQDPAVTGEFTPSEEEIQNTQALDDMLSSHGYNVDTSVFEAIQAAPTVSNITIHKGLIKSFNDENFYSVVLGFTDGAYQVNVQFLAEGKSFMHPFAAQVLSVNQVDISTGSFIEGVPNKSISLADPAYITLFLANYTAKNPDPWQNILPANDWQRLTQTTSGS